MKDVAPSVPFPVALEEGRELTLTKLPPLTREECEAQIDRLLSIKIKRGDRLLVVGDNACGKSLFRDIAGQGFKVRPMVVHASMALRTSNMSHMGGIAGMVRDSEWLATSHNTVFSLRKVIEMADPAKVKANSVGEASDKPVALCVDEPELGLGIAAQRGMVDWLLPRMEEHAAKRSFTMLVTHSPIFVRAFAEAGWTFLDLSFVPYSTAEGWIGRQDTEILDPETLEQRAGILFEVVRDRKNAARAAREAKGKS